ncbi:MAG: hypothetical protein J5594_02980 [Elusimicrobiaceae bacterium]|nr:hypothetical protein [Elusimicrobiaceae bacterium]
MYNNEARNFAKQILLCVSISWWLTSITLVVSKIFFSLPSELKIIISILCIFGGIPPLISLILINKLSNKNKFTNYESQLPNQKSINRGPVPKILKIIMPIIALISAPIVVSILIYASQLD